MNTKAAQRPRGVSGLAVIAAVMIAVLLSLGFWQLQRKEEKRALIDALSSRLAADPTSLPPADQWKSLTPPRDEFRRVAFSGSFTSKPEVSLYSSGSALRPDAIGLGTFVFAAATTASGEIIAVERGFVPDGKSASPLPAGPIAMTGYLRFPESAGWFTPSEDRAKRLWFVRDHRSMASAYGWGDVAPFYIDLEAPIPASGLPKPGPLTVNLKDNHLQYAITWFGLAVAVGIAFAAWLAGQRRARLQPH